MHKKKRRLQNELKQGVKEPALDPNIITCGLTVKTWETQSTTETFKDAVALLSHVLSKLPIHTILKADSIKANGANNLLVQVKILTAEEVAKLKEKKLDIDTKS